MQHPYFPNDDPMATLEAQRSMQKLVNELQRAEDSARTIALPMTDPARLGYRHGGKRTESSYLAPRDEDPAVRCATSQEPTLAQITNRVFD